MKKSSILIICQDLRLTRILQKILEQEEFQYYLTDSLQEGYQLMRDQIWQILIYDDQIKNEKGQEFLCYIYETFEDMEVIVVSSNPSITRAVSAVKTGAVDYISIKHLESRLPALLQTIDKQINPNAAFHQQKLPDISNPDGIIGKSKALQNVLTRVYKAAESRETVLITGESGTGKEMLAHVIHRQNAQSGMPFIPVNCGGIPTGLLESELFGHVKGAYTGAESTTKGYFQAADTGSIFLDEISNTSQAMQAKLLRVLESNEVWKVGTRKPEHIDVRVIAASNDNLRRLVRARKFREDLYYRLNVINIQVPPLRDRQADIELLTAYFARKQSNQLDKKLPQFSDEVLQIFHEYEWPGNIRELKNLVKRVVVLNDNKTITVRDLPVYMHHAGDKAGQAGKSLMEIEQDHIRMIMKEVSGNISKAAKILGISRQTLYNKLEQFSLRRVYNSNTNIQRNKSV